MRFRFNWILFSVFLCFAAVDLQALDEKKAYDQLQSLTSEKRWDKAEIYLISLQKELPEAAWVYANLAWVQREAKKNKEALSTTEEGLKLWPQNSDLQTQKMWALENLGWDAFNASQFDSSAAYFDRARQIDPKEPWARLGIAECKIKLLDLTSAESSLEELMVEFPDFSATKGVLAWCLNDLALKLHEDNNDALAFEKMNRAFRLQSDAAYIVNNWGRVLVWNGKAEEAAAVFEQGSLRFANDPYLFPNWGWALYERTRAVLSQPSSPARTQAFENIAVQIDRFIDRAPVTFSKVSTVLDAFTKIVLNSQRFDLWIRMSRKWNERFSKDAEYLNWTASVESTLNKISGKNDPNVDDRARGVARKAMKIYEGDHPRRPSLEALSFPLKGQVYVLTTWDSDHALTHNGLSQYSYDFMVTNDRKLTQKSETPQSVTDYVTFGQPIFAVCPGKVTAAVDTFEDNALGKLAIEGNYVEVTRADGIRVLYIHLKKGSLKVRAGDSVQAGQEIAAVGNSGYSPTPHLHFTVVDSDNVSLAFRFQGLPAILKEGSFVESPISKP